MESVLLKLLQSDNELIKEGSRELWEALKRPEAIGALCNVLASSGDTQLRQYAAIVLRKRFTKQRHWKAVDSNTANNVKSLLLERLVAEPEKSVKTSIVQLMGTMVVHEEPSTGWPQLVHFLQEAMTSPDSNAKELGFFTLSILTEVAPEQFFIHAGSFMVLFTNTMASLTDPASPIALFITQTMVHLGPHLRSTPQLTNMYVELISRVVVSVKALALKRPDRAMDALDLFYDLAENDSTGILTTKAKQVARLCLELSEEPTLPTELRIKALNLLAIMASLKSKMMEKTKLLEPLIGVVFRALSTQPEDDEDEDYFASDADEDTLVTAAAETLDEVALNNSPQALVPHLMKYVAPALEGNDVYAKKAAFLSMGIIAQGCEEYMRSDSLPQLLSIVSRATLDQQAVIRNAALFALGQFAEYLQPEVSEYCREVMPVMLRLVDGLVEATQEVGIAGDRVLFALEKMSESLEDALVPYLPELLPKLLRLTAPHFSVHLRQLAISAIATTAGAVKEGIAPFLADIMSVLNGFLTQKHDHLTVSLQVESIDALAVIARSVGAGSFGPMAMEALQYGLEVVHTTEDPDLRKSCYGLFGAISTIVKENMAPVLPTIMERILTSISSHEGFVSDVKNDEDDEFPLYESDSGEEETRLDNQGETSIDLTGFAVENDFIEEKEESCFALKELAANVGNALVPYVDSCFSEVMKLLTFPNEDVRRAAFEAAFQLCVSTSSIHPNHVFVGMMERVSKAAVEAVEEDEDRDVAAGVLGAWLSALKEAGPRIVSVAAARQAIVTSIKRVASSPTMMEDEELLDLAGDLLPALGKAMPGPEYATYFVSLIPLFTQKMLNEGDDCGKANWVGLVGECMAGLREHCANEAQSLLPILLSQSKASDPNLRNNAVYALGEMAFHAKQHLAPHYPELLGALSRVLAEEKNAKVMDNVCGAIARLVLANSGGVPLHQVVPVLVSQLPLREDFDEDKWVFGCLSELYRGGHPVILDQLVPVIKAAALTIETHSPSPETKELVVELVRSCSRDFPADYEKAASQLSTESLAALRQACSA